MPDPPGKEVQLKAGNAEIGQMSDVIPSNVFMLLEKAPVGEGMCCCSIPVVRANFTQIVHHPLGKERARCHPDSDTLILNQE